MACRCGDIKTLENKKDTLEMVKESSSTFQENISCSQTEQQYLENDSWSAAESQSLKEETVDDLPEMADKAEETHKKLITEIEKALEEMDRKLGEMKDEDKAHHFAEQMNQQNVG